MTTKFYGSLWVIFAVSAGIVWLGNVFTMVAAVVFGFTAFGLVFVGMMCVLPGLVSHPVRPHVSYQSLEKASQPDPVSSTAAKAFTYRSA